MARKITRKGLIRKLDKAWSLRVRRRGMCEVGGLKCTGVLQAHHICPRTIRATRWDLRNGVCLCLRHHLYYAHQDVMEFSGWLKANRSDDLDYLKERRKVIVKHSDDDLKKILKELSE